MNLFVTIMYFAAVAVFTILGVVVTTAIVVVAIAAMFI